MKKALLALYVLLYGCSLSSLICQEKVDHLYANAFCKLIEAKQNFRVPVLRGDSINILDHYYVDTTNLYYNFTNLEYGLDFDERVSSNLKRGGKEDWERYKQMSLFLGEKYTHQTQLSCFDKMKVNFVSENKVASSSQNYNTLIYSPLFRISENRYKIYEHRFTRYEDHYYIYVFERDGDEFEFIERKFHSDTFMIVKEDYMSTINFDLTYEEFMESRK